MYLFYKLSEKLTITYNEEKSWMGYGIAAKGLDSVSDRPEFKS